MDDRAVSAVVNYVIVLLIVSLLGSGLFLTATDFVQAQQTEAIRVQFQGVGNDLAADLSDADRMARSAEGDSSVELTSDLPDRVAGSSYHVTIRETGDDRYELVLESAEPTVTVTVPFRSTAPVETTTFDGGPVVIRAERTGGTLHPIEVNT